MVWKVNTLRKDYTPEEKAYHFKKLQEMGLSLRGIARECDYDVMRVRAYLNVLKLPEKYQEIVWNNKDLSVSHIQELDSYFNSVVRTTEIVKKLDLILNRRLTRDEFRMVLQPELEEIERKRVESAKEAVGKIDLIVKDPETPEELEKASQALKREAKKRRTPKQVLEEKQNKARNSLLKGRNNAVSKIEKAKKLGLDVSGFENNVKKIKAQIVDDPDEALKAVQVLKKEIDKAIKKEEKYREEEKRRHREEQIREQAEEKAKQELLQDQDFIKKVALALPQIKNETPKPGLPFDVPSVDEQLNKIFGAMSKLNPNKKTYKKQYDFTNYIKGYIKRRKIVCLICGETHLQWSCGHDF